MKETHYKLKHRVTALFAAAVMLCSMLPGAAFAEEPTPQPTEETVQMEQQTEPSETDNGQTDESSPDPGEDVTEATPETAEEQPAEEEISAAIVGAELYTDLPDAPIGSYIGSEGLPVATGETKIGISEWPESQLEEGGSYLTAAALDNDGLTMAAPLLDGADYAIVPIMAQVEYPANGSTLDLVLPDSVTLLDYYGAPAEDAESLLHNEYSEISAAVLGVYVQADANFTAQLVYTAPDGSTLTKTLQVAIDRNATAEYPFPDSEIAAFAERPTPAVTSGKITKVAKVNGTWLIWFNGEPAYCCTPGADGQPKNCPTYTYVNTSMVGADQYVPGDHYGNQYRIWGGLTQLSLGMQELPPVALSAEAPSLLDSCRTIYTDAQMQIIENYPDSTAAKILIGSAQTLLEGTDAYASARGYAIAERMEFEVLPNGEVQTFEMFDDTIKVKISKVDITTNEELPGAELVIKDKDGTEIDRWISTNGPHYVEKMPAGDYTLTEITAPNGYKVAESIDFTVLPTGEMQTVVMKDAREDTPTPTPDNTPTPDHTPQPTPNTTPAPTPVPAAPTATPTPLLTIPKTGDNSSLGLLLAIAGISLAGLAVLVHKSARRKDIAPRDDDDEDTED
ncbi:SpaA isopeptide-forming pilin-related protein [Gemmiger formicilis]|uniref:SpaA isopeptide-forming pilin-related protein n=1 Tax=Gemmiger formicilis TaxID=745368 RepID=UPI00399F9732